MEWHLQLIRLKFPVYNWNAENGATLADISGFQRYPLKTYYLQRDYSGQEEPYWHMVDEPYNYELTGIRDLQGKGNDFSISQNYPNPVENSTSLDFKIPRKGYVSIEIINDKGQVMEILVNKQLSTGSHSVKWDGSSYPSGLYVCRMRFEGSASTQKIMVLH